MYVTTARKGLNPPCTRHLCAVDNPHSTPCRFVSTCPRPDGTFREHACWMSGSRSLEGSRTAG
eukprot:6102617-Prymnesium_polylepis.1